MESTRRSAITDQRSQLRETVFSRLAGGKNNPQDILLHLFVHINFLYSIPGTQQRFDIHHFWNIDFFAIQVAAQIPPARVGSIEVRPVRELSAK